MSAKVRECSDTAPHCLTLVRMTDMPQFGATVRLVRTIRSRAHQPIHRYPKRVCTLQHMPRTHTHTPVGELYVTAPSASLTLCGWAGGRKEGEEKGECGRGKGISASAVQGPHVQSRISHSITHTNLDFSFLFHWFPDYNSISRLTRIFCCSMRCCSIVAHLSSRIRTRKLSIFKFR